MSDTRFTYSGQNRYLIRFPLGGIGTGSVSLDGCGALRDWEIFNKPNKNSLLPFTFAVLFAKSESGKTVTKVVESQPIAPFSHPHGIPRESAAGLPHMKSATFTGKFPFARIDFSDDKMPLKVSLEAYNPFIPGNADDSGLPAAILNYILTNPTDEHIEGTLAFNIYNPIGYPGTGSFTGPFGVSFLGQNVAEFKRCEGLSGLALSSLKYDKESPQYGTMALTTSWNDVIYQLAWLRSGWFDSLQKFWDEFSKDGSLSERSYGPSPDNGTDISAIGLRYSIAPGTSVTLPIYLTWHFPNFEKYWGNPAPACDCEGDCCEKKRPIWKNYYATKYEDAWDVAKYLNDNIKRLYDETKLFQELLFDSTLPDYVIDAVSSQASILKTTTCIRLEDGTFYGFEGCNCDSGCCEGSCTHVWNYAQTQAFLFPSLERSMREADYKYNQFENGQMGFRLQLPLGSGPSHFHPAADGQLGGILKLYRDWKLCGDDEWLRSMWPYAKKALEFAWSKWDPDKDGIIDEQQHNTYDIEFYGANSMMGSFYLGALKAASEIAEYLGEHKDAEEYRRVYESGRKLLDEMIFNGEYYIQKYDPEKVKPYFKDYDPNRDPKYQYGDGCLSDQMIGQWFCHIVDLGYILPADHVKKAINSVYKYNWRRDLSEHPNCQRIYAINDESGLLLCSWPKGNRPEFPFPYSDEVWCGIEYQVASHLIYEGFIDEGLAIVKGVRDRHDGTNRNPWNEFECGNHYARSMASWSVMLALSGFKFDMRKGMLGFAPKINEDAFKCFWSVDGAWGSYSQVKNEADANGTVYRVELNAAYGALTLSELDLGSFCTFKSVKAYVGDNEAELDVEILPAGLRLKFSSPLAIGPEKPLRITIEA